MIRMSEFKLGARVMKTGLAVTLALYLSMLAGLTPVVMAAIAAAISVQPSITKMMDYFGEQVKANLIGAAVALMVLFTMGNSPIIVGATIILVILINLKLGYEKTITMTIVVVIAIMEVPAETDMETLLFALSRMALIVIGVLSAFVINVIFLPPKYEDSLAKKIKSVNNKFFELMTVMRKADMNKEYLSKEIKNLDKEVKTLTHFYSLYKEDKKKNVFKKKRKMSELKPIIVDSKMYNLSKVNHKMLSKLTRIHNMNFESKERLESVDRLIKKTLEKQQNLHFVYEDKIKINFEESYLKCADEEVFDLMIEILSDENIERSEKKRYVVVLSMLNESIKHGENAERMLRNIKRKID